MSKKFEEFAKGFRDVDTTAFATRTPPTIGTYLKRLELDIEGAGKVLRGMSDRLEGEELSNVLEAKMALRLCKQGLAKMRHLLGEND